MRFRYWWISGRRGAACQMMAPAFAQAAAALPQVRFAKVNTQTETTLGHALISAAFHVGVVCKWAEVQRQAGAMDAASIQRWLAAGLRQAGK